MRWSLFGPDSYDNAGLCETTTRFGIGILRSDPKSSRTPMPTGARDEELAKRYLLSLKARTKAGGLGVPRPVAGSQPGPTDKVVSSPNVMTNQRVEKGLL